MADIRCPMCSKPNPAEAEDCGFCGARLKPVLAGGAPTPPGEQQGLPPMPDWLSRLRSPDDSAPEATPPGSDAGEDDWLARLRASDPQWSSGEGSEGGGGSTAATPARSSGEGPDWLNRLREASSEETGPPQGEVPDWLAEPQPPAASPAAAAAAEGEDVPDWLARVRARRTEDQGDGALSDEGSNDALDAVLPDVFNLERTGWHSGLTGLLPEPTAEAPDALPSARPSMPVWMDEGGAEDRPLRTGELPGAPQRKPTSPLKPEPAPEDESPPAVGQRTGELPRRGTDRLKAKDEKAGTGALRGRSTGRLARLAAAAKERERTGPLGTLPAETPPVETPPAEAAASWPPSEPSAEPPQRSTGRLAALVGLGAGEASQPPTPPVAPPPVTPPFGFGDLEDETGLSSLAPAFEEPDSQPTRPPAVLPTTVEPPAMAPASDAMVKSDWLRELEQPVSESAGLPAMPSAPALVLPEGEVGDFDLGSLEVPDWLADAGSMPSDAAIAPEQRPDLAPATLPTWLEAMRPVDTFHSVVEILPEEDQAVESAGPLAGLRGVLMAEPVVALPRITGVGSTRLNVSERQTAQAEALHKLVQDELREIPAMTRARARLPLLRWAIGGMLLLAVALPILLRLSVFALPTVEPVELGQLVGLVAGLPGDRPVLLVFDYEPASAGELEVVAGPLLEDLMSKGLPIATLSTRPTGPPLAERLMRQRGAGFDYRSGEDYVHLGYLSGGVPAIQLFAAGPRTAVLSGFAAAIADGGSPAAGWNAPLLANVSSLSDFGMVAVITAGAETARAWTEQTSPWLAGRPLVMVLSAGVEPMIRPYYESLTPAVNGLLSGEPAAVAYELRNGRAGPAVARWNPFSLGILVSEVLLAGGAVYGLGAWLLSALRPKPKAKRS